MGLVIDHIQELHSDWKKRTYILLIRPENVPPHLALMVQGQYFSMSVKGHSLGDEGQIWLDKLSRKKIPVLWVEVDNLSTGLVQSKFEQSIKDTALGQVTCLHPIKTIFEVQASFIFELLPQLSNHNKVIAYAMTPKANNQITIPEYTTEEILQYIKSLKQRQNV